MQTDGWVVVGLDNGGNKNNATVLDASGRFLVDELLESPSRVTEGPDVAIESLVLSFEDVLRRTGIARERIRGVGLDTPGPASAEGVISARGSTNFAHPGWRNYAFAGGLEDREGHGVAVLPVGPHQFRRLGERLRPPRARGPGSGSASRAGGCSRCR